ncbi:MAG: alpha-L-rhamnosidase, partial [Frankiales bacterium]|nr:alpha-L-rhamnosidase [Frankiales bacterium]
MEQNSPWRASWVWAVEDTPSAGRTAVALRRDVQVGSAAATLPCRIAAVGRYALFVNGTEVARGPARANPRMLVYDVVDLGHHLRPGANAIGVLAWCWAHPMPWWHPLWDARNELSRGALALEADLDGCATDETWSARVLTGWDTSPPQGVPGRGIEVIDAESLPVDWLELGAADAWPAAVTRAPYAPGRVRHPRPPSYPGGPVRARTVSGTEGIARPLFFSGGAWTTGDVGVVSGTVRLDVEGLAGASLDVQVA